MAVISSEGTSILNQQVASFVADGIFGRLGGVLVFPPSSVHLFIIMKSNSLENNQMKNLMPLRSARNENTTLLLLSPSFPKL